MTRIEYMEERMQLTEQLLTATITTADDPTEENKVSLRLLKQYYQLDLLALKARAITQGVIPHE